MKEYILIEDGQLKLVKLGRLEDLQGAVGGMITTAPITPRGRFPGNTTAYANDEGLLIGMAPNNLASFLCGYPLVGPVIVRATKAVMKALDAGGFTVVS